MSYIILNKIPTEKDVKNDYKLSSKSQSIKSIKDKEILNILQGTDNRKLAIVGPCSVDDVDTACKYAENLAKIQEKVKDKIFIIIRAYSVKPRSVTTEYKGIVHSPNPLKKENISLGIKTMRNLQVKVFEESYLPIADELLYPDLYKYIDDIVSYLTIGARSTENQYYKLLSSAVEQPIGFKNPLSGNIINTIDSIISSRNPANCILDGNEIRTTGNMLSHMILRGYTTNDNEHCSNYMIDDLSKIIKLLEDNKLYNLPIIIDASHSNSGKNSKQQELVINNVINTIKHNNLIEKYIKGFMIESYIYEGNQGIKSNYLLGKSLTDSCISIEDTERILLDISERNLF